MRITGLPEMDEHLAAADEYDRIGYVAGWLRDVYGDSRECAEWRSAHAHLSDTEQMKHWAAQAARLIRVRRRANVDFHNAEGMERYYRTCCEEVAAWG